MANVMLGIWQITIHSDENRQVKNQNIERRTETVT